MRIKFLIGERREAFSDILIILYLDSQCLRVDIRGSLMQVSVCQNKAEGDECEPSALLWVGVTFIILGLAFLVTIVTLWCYAGTVKMSVQTSSDAA